jgi:glycosyltransferase involved in cell wall biosynthesis
MGLNYDYFSMDREEAIKQLEPLDFDVNRPYILHVGKANWYKNRKGLVDVFNGLIQFEGYAKYALVFAGAALCKKEKDHLKKTGIKNRVHEIVSPKNEDLRALYSLASVLVYPSLAEGFGWPIIEAQACGCPVFTTGRPPMTEAGGDAAVYFDPGKPEEAARIIADTLNNPGRIERMKKLGLENVKRFSTDKMIQEYIKVYREVIETGPATCVAHKK